MKSAPQTTLSQALFVFLCCRQQKISVSPLQTAICSQHFHFNGKNLSSKQSAAPEKLFPAAQKAPFMPQFFSTDFASFVESLRDSPKSTKSNRC
ncbi:hypothetical protein CLOSTMETH_01559 [[Clostridium] methylpentosum DSM 5476]|uniref:Uncharacterized protein n=1 Tax=[Clostridium] methylpentosum DSM 5476 TaxID=537013 RepID=C0ECI8_9FIRM|nr:hypothetical protein CLOSTMETH_01559 [[Clostridium] methylpentosum DSM 5476]